MSEENVEIVRRSFELVNEVGTDAFIGGNFWSDDWVFDASGTGIPGLGVYRGHDEIRAFFEEAGSPHFHSRSGRSTSAIWSTMGIG